MGSGCSVRQARPDGSRAPIYDSTSPKNGWAKIGSGQGRATHQLPAAAPPRESSRATRSWGAVDLRQYKPKKWLGQNRVGPGASDPSAARGGATQGIKPRNA